MLLFYRVMELYNEVEKESFILERISTKSLIRMAKILFNKTEEFEKLFGKDVSQFTEQEANEIVKSLQMMSLGSLYNYRAIMKAYISWCDMNMVFDNISYGFLSAFSTDTDFSDKCLWFKDPQDLYISMRKVRDFDSGYAEPPLLCFAWLGLDKQTSYDLLDSQVDMENRRIFDNDGNIISTWESEEISDVLTRYIDCKIAYRENASCTYPVIKDIGDKHFLKKFCPQDSPRLGESYTSVQLDSGLHRFSIKYKSLGFPDKMKYRYAWESGRLFEIYTIEQAGFNINDPNNQGKILDAFKNAKSLRNILWMYGNYKQAFNL